MPHASFLGSQLTLFHPSRGEVPHPFFLGAESSNSLTNMRLFKIALQQGCARIGSAYNNLNCLQIDSKKALRIDLAADPFLDQQPDPGRGLS